MNNYNEKLEQNLIDMVKQKEESDRRLLTLEVAIGVITLITFLSATFIASFAEMADYVRFAIIIIAFITFIPICLVMLKIEQVAGYYECQKCHHKYIPTYAALNFAPHFGRTRYMKCPECGNKSWQKKVIHK